MTGNDVILFGAGAAGSLQALLADPRFAAAAADVSADVKAFQSFGQISIKGKAWTMVQGDTREVMKKPDGDPVQSLEVVILRANDNARTYYEGEYVEGQDSKPVCYSNDNIAPSDRSERKQSPRCSTCRWAVFGTARKRDGTMGKGTACSSNARLAVAAPDAIDKPMMIRVPPTSLRPMRDAIDVVRKRNIAYPIVLMRLQFVAEEASPVLKFTPIGLLGQESAVKSIGMREDSVVRAICGLDDVSPPSDAVAQAPAPVTPPADPLGAGLDAAIAARAAQQAAVPTPAPVPAPVAPPAPAMPPVTATPSPAPTPAPVTAPIAAAPIQAPPVAAPPTTAPSVTVATGSLLGDLNDLLGGVDK